MCVQVCPTGIDIRDGLQYECIACGACIDACDQVMDRMGYPRGLIRYTTENALEGKPTHVLRPRVIVYSVLLLALLVGTLTAVAMRTPCGWISCRIAMSSIGSSMRVLSRMSTR
ncbi:MAG: 4Fe-4S dicluster domain-containing protein [Arhodomonas sp.]|nr:4Fe-4S dicluster domain-containing protein [Arhodomonas sp.]